MFLLHYSKKKRTFPDKCPLYIEKIPLTRFNSLEKYVKMRHDIDKNAIIYGQVIECLGNNKIKSTF